MSDVCSEVSNMTLRGSLTSNDSSLSSLVCILLERYGSE